MEKLIKSKNGQWSLINEDLNKAEVKPKQIGVKPAIKPSEGASAWRAGHDAEQHHWSHALHESLSNHEAYKHNSDEMHTAVKDFREAYPEVPGHHINNELHKFYGKKHNTEGN